MQLQQQEVRSDADLFMSDDSHSDGNDEGDVLPKCGSKQARSKLHMLTGTSPFHHQAEALTKADA